MAYCSDADIELLLPQPRQFLREGEVDFSGQIALAEADINADLKAIGYDVPFAAGAVPALVKQLTVFKTCQLLCVRQGLEEMAGTYRRMAQEKMDRLETGLAETPEDDEEEGSLQSTRGVVVNASGEDRRFTKETMSRW